MSRKERFWQRQGCGGNRTPVGMTGAREGERGGSTDIEEYGCGGRHKYAGTETVNAQVGG